MGFVCFIFTTGGLVLPQFLQDQGGLLIRPSFDPQASMQVNRVVKKATPMSLGLKKPSHKDCASSSTFHRVRTQNVSTHTSVLGVEEHMGQANAKKGSKE